MVRVNPYADLANRCFRPLSHLSGFALCPQSYWLTPLTQPLTGKTPTGLLMTGDGGLVEGQIWRGIGSEGWLDAMAEFLVGIEEMKGAD